MQWRCVVPSHEKKRWQTSLQHPQPRGSPERATKLPPKSLFEVRSIMTITWARDVSQLLCRDTKRETPCKGGAKKYYPKRSGGVEIFLATLVIPLQGAKRLLRQRGSEHRFPAHTLTIGTKTLCRSRNKKTKHLKSGWTERSIEQEPSSRGKKKILQRGFGGFGGFEGFNLGWSCKISLQQCKNFLHFFNSLFLIIVDNQTFTSLAWRLFSLEFRVESLKF